MAEKAQKLDFEINRTSKGKRSVYTHNTKVNCVKLSREVGVPKAAEMTGITDGVLYSWVKNPKYAKVLDKQPKDNKQVMDLKVQIAHLTGRLTSAENTLKVERTLRDEKIKKMQTRMRALQGELEREKQRPASNKVLAQLQAAQAELEAQKYVTKQLIKLIADKG